MASIPNLDGVSRKIAPNDDMYTSGPDWYFLLGEVAIGHIFDAIENNSSLVQRILDIPSGFGRVLRYLRHNWPRAEIVACDINREAVDFCTAEFGAFPVYSDANLKNIKIEPMFDVIWCGSLLTHFSEAMWGDFLAFIWPLLAHNGTFVFTTHGRIAAYLAEQRNPVYGLSDTQFSRLVSDYKAKGFAYVNYDDRYPFYGISLSYRLWVMRKLEELPGCKVSLLKEQAWGHHDVWGITKQAL